MSKYLELQYGDAAKRKHNEFPGRLIDFLEEKFSLRGPRTLLELGPGTGDFTKAWRDVGMETHTVDRSGTELTDTKADLSEDEWGCWLKDRHQFDVVFHKNVIEHIRDPEHMMEQTLMLMRPGAVIIVMCPDWRTYMKTFYDDYTHIRPYDVVSLSDLLKASGLENVTCERVYQYPAMWTRPWLRGVATLWRWFTPVEFSLWLSKTTGVQFFRWASQLSLLAYGTKPV